MTKIQMSGSVLTVMWGQSEREEKHVDLSVQDCLGLSDSNESRNPDCFQSQLSWKHRLFGAVQLFKMTAK